MFLWVPPSYPEIVDVDVPNRKDVNTFKQTRRCFFSIELRGFPIQLIMENDARSEVVAEMGAGSVVVHCKSQGKQTSACLTGQVLLSASLLRVTWSETTHMQ